MATVTLKNIPKALYDRLKELAKIRHRSLNSEIIFNLEKAMGTSISDQAQLRKDASDFRNRIALKGQLSPEEIEAAINEGRP